MICTGVVPCLSTGWLKMIKLCQCLSYFPGFLAILKVCIFFKNGRTNLTPKQSNMIFWSNFERYNNKVEFFKKARLF